MRTVAVGAATLAVLLVGLGAGAAPASATRDQGPDATTSARYSHARTDRLAEPAPAPERPGAEVGPADRIAKIKPEALVTTATVLALAMGATGVATAVRARRRARE